MANALVLGGGVLIPPDSQDIDADSLIDTVELILQTD